MKANNAPNLIHSMDAEYCNRIMDNGESHFPKLKSQKEIDADASYFFFSWVVELTSKVRKLTERKFGGRGDVSH